MEECKKVLGQYQKQNAHIRNRLYASYQQSAQHSHHPLALVLWGVLLGVIITVAALLLKKDYFCGDEGT